MPFTALLFLLTIGMSSCYVGYESRHGHGHGHRHHHHHGY
jgi:hypothetical protein